MTVVEVMVAATLFAIFLGGAFSFYLVHQRATARGQQKIEVQQNLRVALAVATREIRMAGYDPDAAIPSLPTPARVQTARPDLMTFVADLDDDGHLDRVTYRLAGTSLMRDLASWNGSSFGSEIASELAGGIVGLSFDYFVGDALDADPIPAPVGEDDLGEIRRVALGLVARRPSSASSEETLALKTNVTLRNAR